MRLFEITQPTYYLHTTSKQPIGSTATRQSPIYPLGAAYENQLEDRRPEGCLPRDKSFYLSPHPNLDAEYVYEVEVVGNTDRLHTGWLQQLQKIDIMNMGEVDQYASGYWSGRLLSELQSEPWEYRALEVKVLKRVGGTARTERF